MARNRARKPARYLAPLALAAAVAAGYLVVHDSLRKATVPTTPTTASSGPHGALPQTSHKHGHGPQFYVVHSGDTLSGISHKVKVSMASLVALNPRLNPNVLRTGQRLRLRR